MKNGRCTFQYELQLIDHEGIAPYRRGLPQLFPSLREAPKKYLDGVDGVPIVARDASTSFEHYWEARKPLQVCWPQKCVIIHDLFDDLKTAFNSVLRTTDHIINTFAPDGPQAV